MSELHVFLDTEFTETGVNADLISLALVSGNKQLYIEITDSWTPEDCSDFVQEVVLPLLGRHDPERLTRDQAGARVTEWLRDLRSGDLSVPVVVIADYAFDWLQLAELNTAMPGEPTWAKAQNIAGRLAQNMVGDAIFEATDRLLEADPERHHALVDALALQRAFEGLYIFPVQALTQPALPAAEVLRAKVLNEDDEMLAGRNVLLANKED